MPASSTNGLLPYSCQQKGFERSPWSIDQSSSFFSRQKEGGAVQNSGMNPRDADYQSHGCSAIGAAEFVRIPRVGPTAEFRRARRPSTKKRCKSVYAFPFVSVHTREPRV